MKKKGAIGKNRINNMGVAHPTDANPAAMIILRMLIVLNDLHRGHWGLAINWGKK